MIKFEWDEQKNKQNRSKHGVWFEEVFNDDHARVFFDEEHSEHEDRFIIVGASVTGRILVVVHCQRSNNTIVRIISARKATAKEREIYEEGI